MDLLCLLLNDLGFDPLILHKLGHRRAAGRLSPQATGGESLSPQRNQMWAKIILPSHRSLALTLLYFLNYPKLKLRTEYSARTRHAGLLF